MTATTTTVCYSCYCSAIDDDDATTISSAVPSLHYYDDSSSLSSSSLAVAEGGVRDEVRLPLVCDVVKTVSLSRVDDDDDGHSSVSSSLSEVVDVPPRAAMATAKSYEISFFFNNW
mmetsp:Transcript_29682/g.36130  ORF Transcript_29682/g.36130 Transcript_29682/m.36130 type:complete len:116 (+) Transcript_29682:1040-1387(+)